MIFGTKIIRFRAVYVKYQDEKQVIWNLIL
jgi:hypothetical protein